MLVHHATGEPVARVSQANSGMIARDIRRMAADALEPFPVAQLLTIARRAADLFASAALPLGDRSQPAQTFDEYIRQLSATTGMPHAYCRTNAEKVRNVLLQLETVLAGLTRGVPTDVLDRGCGIVDGRSVSFRRDGRVFGAVLPSNSPGVHTLWIPAFVLKAPLVLKPGAQEPWTPLRVIAALVAAGAPREAFGFYPTDHAGAGELLRNVDRAMLFGDAGTTRPWAGNPKIELHGPGFSKVIFGDDGADEWRRHVEMMASSIAANGGRSCINASGIWTPRHAREIAEALAARLAAVEALPADDPRAELAAFADASVAERISALIDQLLREPGAEDVTERIRGRARLVRQSGPGGRPIAWLLPTIIRCDRPDHPLANREFLFPMASVVECPTSDMLDAIGPTLVASAITRDDAFAQRLMRCGQIDRLNLGAIPTWQMSWDQPHEGNLFDLLYRRRALQRDSAA